MRVSGQTKELELSTTLILGSGRGFTQNSTREQLRKAPNFAIGVSIQNFTEPVDNNFWNISLFKFQIKKKKETTKLKEIRLHLLCEMTSSLSSLAVYISKLTPQPFDISCYVKSVDSLRADVSS